MSKFKTILSWVGIVILGLAHGVLEDLMYIQVVMEYAPPSWDLTGNLFYVLTVPLPQLMSFAITGTLAWYFLGLKQLPKLVTFWVCWVVARAAFLAFGQNPIGDITVYLVWITLWCLMVGLYARSETAVKHSTG
ncbi:MAG: hypothetical protein GWP50_10860 [Proteobacteria bacterium]|nr:hypothetical protein [Pseudomonadota bacterium]